MRTLITSSLLIVAFVMASFASSLRAAQEGACGNGQPWQFSVGMQGHINPYPPSDTPNNLRATPGGDIVAQVYPGEIFTIVAGPECTPSTGTSWWYVATDDGREGWTAQGNAEEYWIIPYFDPDEPSGIGAGENEITVPDDYPIENFRTKIELDIAAPVNKAAEQLSYGSGFGGGGCGIVPTEPVPPVITYVFGRSQGATDHQFDFTGIPALAQHDFGAGKRVDVTIYHENGTVLLETSLIGALPDPEMQCYPVGDVGLFFEFKPDSPAGEWILEFKGENGDIVTQTTILVPHSDPWKSVYCAGDEYQLILDGFQPGESVQIELIELEYISESGEQGGRFDSVHESKLVAQWEVNVDKQGQLVVEFADTVAHSSLRALRVIDDNNSFSPSDGKYTFFDLDFDDFSPCKTNPNNTTEIGIPYIEEGYINADVPVQELMFDGRAGQFINITMSRFFLEGLLEYETIDPFVQLVSPSGEVIAENDDVDNPSGFITPLDAHIGDFELPETGTYTIILSSVDDTEGTYKIVVE
ncbi:MAG: SH3 domain-containing protein [Anaerolineae bacterium]|nr:SH3 domain-containing protein [Anaerolineae bacterium]